MLADRRLRVTRIYDVLNNIPKDPAELLSRVWLAWGTQDDEFTDCRLTHQSVSGQTGPFRKPVDEPPQLVRVYEEIPENDRVQVGDPGVSFDQFGRKSVEINYVQFSAGTSIYNTVVGTTAAPAPFTDCILQHFESTNDGTLITSKYTFIDAGVLSDTEQLKFGGKLLLRTIRSLNEVPATPAGFTLVSTGTEFTEGLPVYVYGYAAGGGGGSTGTGGQINESTTYQDSSNQGTTGVTIISSKYLTDLTVTDNPITAPSGFIAGTSIFLIATTEDTDSGFKLWGATWARGVGEIGRDVTYQQSNDAGTTGVTVTTITHLTLPGIVVNPTTAPAGSVLVKLDHTDEDGYKKWVAVYASGTGTVTTETDIQNDGKLYIYTKVAINAAPSAPSPTIAGTVTLISTDVRLESGVSIYSYKWAEGVGEISRAIQYQQSQDQGTLGVTLTTIRYLVAPAATVQPTSLSGSVQIGQDFQDESGVRIWTTRWAKGTGLVSQAIHARQDGLREVTNIALGTRVAPSGDVIRDDYRLDEGFTVYTVTSIQAANGTDPTTSGSTISFERYVPFLYPGRAKAYSLTASNGWKAYDVFRSPPVKADVKATITVSYQTGNTLGTISDYWNPSEWAVIQAEWIGLNNVPGFAVVALPGYRTTSATPLTFTATVWEDGVAGTMLGNVVFGGTTAILTVTGGPADPGGSTFTLDATIEPAYTKTDGTKVYRKTLVTAAIPAQAALPV
jgi:hypothetical protein